MGDKSNHPGASGNPATHPVMQELNGLVDRWIAEHNQKQETLAKDCGLNPADLSHFLKGDRTLPTYGLVNLATKLSIDPARLVVIDEILNYFRKSRKSSAPEDATKSAEAVAKKREAATKERDGWKRAQKIFEDLLQRLPSGEIVHSPVIGARTLRDWPESFLPHMIFVGDRRERPPKSAADLLAASASLGDLYYLPQLQLPPETEIRSDKTVSYAHRNIRDLIKDKNLLVIGGPAANLMARVVNRGACFSFVVNPEELRRASELQEQLELHDLPTELERYTSVHAGTPEEQKWSRVRRHIISTIAHSGILDPVDYVGPRAVTTPPGTDYGVISLCKHPWSENRSAIIAAGVHGPATAAAIKLLSQPNAFANRPLGGVFHVHVPLDKPWEKRYHHLSPEFDTHEYTIEGYASAKQRFVEKCSSELGSWDHDAVGQLLRQLLGSTEPSVQETGV